MVYASVVPGTRCRIFRRENGCMWARWRVPHAFGTSLPGWLVMLPHRHVVMLDELRAEEAADLGPLLRAVTTALREVLGWCAVHRCGGVLERTGTNHLFHPRGQAVGRIQGVPGRIIVAARPGLLGQVGAGAHACR